MNFDKYALNTNPRLGEMENEDNWLRHAAECSVCHKYGLKNYCQIQNEWECSDCAADEFKQAAKSEDIAALNFNIIMQNMGAKNSLRWRFLFLSRFQELYKKEKKIARYSMKVLLIQQLGYIARHPLAWNVRHLAYDVCFRLGREIVPLLVKLYRKNPWQFQINVTMLAARIAPASEKVEFMVTEAANHSRKEVRTRIVELLGEIDRTGFPWINSLLLQLALDKDNDVSKKAKVLLPKTTAPQPSKKEMPDNQLPLEITGRTLLDFYKELQKKQSDELVETIETLQDIYATRKLVRIFNVYIVPFLKSQNLIDLDISTNKLKKRQLANIFAHVLLDEKLFSKLYLRFSERLKKAIERLVWEGTSISVKELESIIGKKVIPERHQNRYYDANRYMVDDFLLFQTNITFHYWENQLVGYFYFDPRLRMILKRSLPFPRDGIIKSVDKIPENLLVYSDDNHFAQHVDLFMEYLKQGNIQYSKTNGAVLKGSIKKWISYFDIKEFFPEGDRYMEFLFSKLIIEFLRKLEEGTPRPKTAEDVKKLILAYFRGKKFKGYSEFHLLNHIHGDFFFLKSKEKNIRWMFYTLLKEMRQDNWIPASNILKNVLYREEELSTIQFNRYLNYLFINAPYSNDYYSGYYKLYLTVEMFPDVFFKPLIKGLLFLGAALGLVDIAYDLPVNKKYHLKNRDYLSPFEGLKFVRISEFGRYVLGLKDNFEIKREEEPTKITLDANRLLITVEGSARIERMILEQMAEKAIKNRYKFSYQSFLKNCHSVDDIRKNINSFKENVCSQLPENWKDFFQGIEEKINPLHEREGFRIFKITPNREFISLIANDKVLKNNILKMEDLQIAIKEENVRMVVKRLREFGFFVDNL